MTVERVLVTGGAGFIGSHVAEYYAKRGCDVKVADNLAGGDATASNAESPDSMSFNLDYLERNYANITFSKADVRDAERMCELVRGRDAVIHTAGQVAVTTSLEDPRTDFEINAKGTFNVLEAVRRADNDPALVFASTNKVYGDNINDIPVEEGDTRYRYADADYRNGVPESMSIDGCEHTPYGVSKLSGDLYVQDYVKRGLLDAAVFRMSCIYGPRQFGTEDQGWVAHFARSAIRGEPLTIFGDGKQVRDVLYVKDLVRAYDAFVQDPSDKPTVYNIGGGPSNWTSLLELLDRLEAALGHRPSVEFDDWRDADQRVYISDISRAEATLGWQPEVGFEEGLNRLLRWCRRGVG